MRRSAGIHLLIIVLAMGGLASFWYHRRIVSETRMPPPGSREGSGSREPSPASAGSSIDPPAAPAPPDLPKGSLKILLREGGKPVAGVNFTMLEEASNHMEVLTSGPDGAHLVKGLPPGQYHLNVTHPDFVQASAHPKVDPGEDREIAINLDRGARVEGRVTDAGGRPLAGVDVLLFTVPKGSTVPNVTPVRTDAEGQYRMVSIPVGSFDLRFRHASHRIWRKPDLFVTQPGEIFRIDVVLQNGRTLAGRVLDADQKPLAGVSVVGTNEETSACKSDAQGAFLLQGLGDGPVRCFTSAAGYGFTSATALPDSTSVVLILTKAAELFGRIESRPPPTVYSVRLSKFITEHAQYVPLYSRSFNAAEFSMNEIPPGHYRLEIKAAGFESQDAPELDISAGQTVTGIQVRLRKTS